MINMTPTPSPRRDFVRTGISATSAFALNSCTTSMKQTEQTVNKSQNNAVGYSSVKRPDCLDYSRPFLKNTGEHNAVRMMIESRTTIYDLESGSQSDYFQCARCKIEDTFAKENLIYKDNYAFLLIFGEDKVLVFRSFTDHRNDRFRKISSMTDMWGKAPLLHLPVPDSIAELDSTLR